MVKACIRIELSDGQWKTDVSQDHADLSFQLLSAVMDSDRATETVVVSGGTTAECLSDIDSHPDVDAFEIIDQRKRSATVQLETIEAAVLSSTSRAKTPLTYPATVNHGRLTATVIGTHSALSSLGDQLRAEGLGFDVTYVQSDHDISQVLTDRQGEVLRAAVKHGYYANPRECTLTDVADVLGIAKSSCSVTLQRAEGAIIQHFLSQQRRSDLATENERPELANSFS